MKFAMGPDTWDVTVRQLAAAGHELVALDEAEVYLNTRQDPALFPQLPPSIRWVQHCFTGVNVFIEAGLISDAPGAIPWANAAGAFAKPVAESALALLLSTAHRHTELALEASWARAREIDEAQFWLYPQGRRRRVVVLGAGGIGKELIRMLAPFDVHVTAVTRSGREVPGADAAVGIGKHMPAVAEADVVVAILPLTEATRGLIGAAFFRAMPAHALFVNVGRGATVVTDDLVDALRNWEIAGAGLDVVDPEPLPDGHPLFALPNATVTPHMAASGQVAQFHIPAIFEANAAAFARGERMPTQVDPKAGY